MEIDYPTGHPRHPSRFVWRLPQQRAPLGVSSSEDDEGVESGDEPVEHGQGGTCLLGDRTGGVSLPPPGAAGDVEDEGEVADLRSWQEREIRTRHAIVELEVTLATDAVNVGRAFTEARLAFDPLTFIASRVLELADSEDTDPYDLLVWLVEDGSIERAVELAVEGLDADSGVGT
jgi:hypothetical protein